MQEKRGKNARNALKLGVFVALALFSINLVSSETLISGGKVVHNNALNIFTNEDLAIQMMWDNKTNYQTLKIIDNEVWLKVTVELKDNSGIDVIGNKTEKIALSKEVDKWFGSKIDGVISALSDEDVRGTNKLSRGFGALISKQGLEKIIDNEDVKEVSWPTYGVHALLDESAPLINADEAWGSGYTGEDVKVCIIDTGIDTTHPDLSGRIVDEKCYCCSDYPNCGNNDEGCCPDGTAEDDSAEDDGGHGTHVAGIIASEDSTYRGLPMRPICT